MTLKSLSRQTFFIRDFPLQLISTRLAELEEIGAVGDEVGDEAAATLSEVESGAQDRASTTLIGLDSVGLESVSAI